ncbi:hypothetical protein [Kitasatospora camelliae]|uniref:Uncharacterized protein n=1 Tax=Kitasatospora camelliae TaxID=3156397 RepID=A0AAU8K4X3_9ACTN
MAISHAHIETPDHRRPGPQPVSEATAVDDTDGVESADVDLFADDEDVIFRSVN